MKLLRLILILPCLITLGACVSNSSSTDSGTPIFDPGIPGGVIGGTTTIQPLQDVTADTSVEGQITLNWTVPAVYLPLNYQVMIYKHEGNDSTFVLPDPTQGYTSASLYLLASVQGGQYVDSNPADGSVLNISDDTYYNYWLYLFVDNTWSTPVNLLALSASGTTTITLPTPANFWSSELWAFGNDPDVVTAGSTALFETASTMLIKTNQCTLQATSTLCGTVTGCAWVNGPSGGSCQNLPDVGNPRGKVAIANNGSTMYVADTDNNRILVYNNAEVQSCLQFLSDSELFDACMLGAEGFPFEPYNILGQPNQNAVGPCVTGCENKISSTTCGAAPGCSWDDSALTCSPTFPMNECLTRPTSVMVSGSSLYISDSGNNRIVVWNHLPTWGCDPNVIATQTTPADCTPDYQIGKKSLDDDTTTYSLAANGDDTFNNPTGVAISNDGNDIYIADTGNNRVVRIANYLNTQSFSCNATNWETPLCSFTEVLGQPSFFVSNSLNSLIAQDIHNQQGCSILGTQSSCLANTSCYWIPGQIGGVCNPIDTIINPDTIGQNIRQVVGEASVCSVATTPTDCSNAIAGPGCTCNYNLSNQFSCSCKASSGFGCAWDTTNLDCVPSPSANANIMKRYFANPTTIKITPTDQLLVEANENYSATSTINTPIKMNSRIMIWGVNPMDTVAPRCPLGAFQSGGCDATDVMGQQDFHTLVALSSNTANYYDTSYGLQALADFDITGNQMIGVDSVNNFVYLWSNWQSQAALGHPPVIVVNPNGAPDPIKSGFYPVLKDLTGCTIDPLNELLYVTDGQGHRVYQIQSF
jgi:DNA-binding beta-propeller fold protein YncE